MARQSKKRSVGPSVDAAVVRAALSQALGSQFVESSAGDYRGPERGVLATGFSEANAGLETSSLLTGATDEKRFAESVRLARAFALVERAADRQLLISAAEVFAGLGPRLGAQK